MVMAIETQANGEFLEGLAQAFAASNREFARAYYLFATARLTETYNSEEIYGRYPVLTDEATFLRLKAIYDANPSDEETSRMFTNTLGTFIGAKLASLSDALENTKNQLKIDVADLGLKNAESKAMTEMLYEDVSEWLKRTAEKPVRQALYDRMAAAWTRELAPRFIDLFQKENALLAELGYQDLIAFYAQTSGHDLRRLGENGKRLVSETQTLYHERMARIYREMTGHDFETEATRADISFVLQGKSPEMAAIDRRFPKEVLMPLARRTFDGLGLNFSQIATEVDFADMEAYKAEVVRKGEDPAYRNLRRILLDVGHREGKRSRAYVYPAAVPSEIYLSLKPEGGLDDFSTFFHESGHAQHFAYEDPSLSFAMAQMGNNTTTETYAYLMQNLFLNRHWLVAMAGLTEAEAAMVVRKQALNDLYMLRRYGSKMQFELRLFDGVHEPGYTLADKGGIYAELLTLGCGFRYDADGWSRDVDAGFYVADYFTAWSLEAQLREYLSTHYGSKEAHGEDWYANPDAGAFLQSLWKDGNIAQQILSDRLGYHDPTDVGPLLRLMNDNLTA